MVKEFFELLRDEVATWILITVMFIIGFVKLGPRFVTQIMGISDRLKEKSDLLRKEYLAELEITLSRYKDKNDDLKKENQRLRGLVHGLTDEMYELRKEFNKMRKENGLQ